MGKYFNATDILDWDGAGDYQQTKQELSQTRSPRPRNNNTEYYSIATGSSQAWKED